MASEGSRRPGGRGALDRRRSRVRPGRLQGEAGRVPRGFPPFTIPDVSLVDPPLLHGGALGIAPVALTDTISTVSAFAARRGQEVSANQEIIGIGAASVAAGLFQGSRSVPAVRGPRWLSSRARRRS